MEYRAQVRRARYGFDAWTPDLPGCAANGTTEAEALANLRHAIEGRLDVETYEDQGTAVERFVSIEPPQERLANAERLAEKEPAPAVAIPPFLSFGVGGTLFALGMAGVFSFIIVEPPTSPVVFFASAIIAALGAGGILMGLLTQESSPKTAP